MLENLEIDDSDSPAISLVPPGVSWDEVRDHIKIAHNHLLVLDGGDYVGSGVGTPDQLIGTRSGARAAEPPSAPASPPVTEAN